MTEIAIYIHDGKEIVQEFSSLINPECSIPYHITQITGITDEMVSNAPKFFEIARDIVEITDNRIFVAHNVNFDYEFIRNEFQRLGYDFKRDRLCTVRLSRKLFPGLPSYSLGRLCENIGIPIRDRHRAGGDAFATAQLFELLYRKNEAEGKDYIQNGFRIPQNLHPKLDPSTLKNLPESTGVYYLLNDENELIYIGKSKNIRKRILSHFSNNSSKRAMEMCRQVTDIGFDLTGNELIALLKESYEIKKFKPFYNRAQKRTSWQYGIFSERDLIGYIHFSIQKTAKNVKLPLFSFTSRAEAIRFMKNMIDAWELCQKLCGMYGSSSNCFHYEIGSCKGACIGKEDVVEYNKRALQAIQHYSFEHQNLMIIDKGRNAAEGATIKIENGKYIGYGYFDREYAVSDPQVVSECVSSYDDSREIRNIIVQYLRKNSVEKMIVC